LKGGLDAWEEAGKTTDEVTSIPADQFEKEFNAATKPVFDVRRNSESAPLSELNDHLAVFPKEDNFYVHCAGGYRSMIAASILKARAYHNLINIEGGFGAIKKTGLETTEFVCPSTLKL